MANSKHNKFQQTNTFFLHDWKDFYSDKEPSNVNTYKNQKFTNIEDESTNPQRISLETDLYVVNCYFYSIIYSGNGAAIPVSGNFSFLVEFSTFVECAVTGTNSRAGGLYILDANFAMNHVCALECNSSHESSFTRVTNPGRIINSIHYSSIANCVSKDYYTMRHRYGFIDIESVNLSHNTAISYSAIACYPSLTKCNNNIGTSIRYSSFSDNIASNYKCIYMASYASQIESTNIINNHQNDPRTN